MGSQCGLFSVEDKYVSGSLVFLFLFLIYSTACFAVEALGVQQMNHFIVYSSDYNNIKWLISLSDSCLNSQKTGEFLFTIIEFFFYFEDV